MVTSQEGRLHGNEITLSPFLEVCATFFPKKVETVINISAKKVNPYLVYFDVFCKPFRPLGFCKIL